MITIFRILRHCNTVNECIYLYEIALKITEGKELLRIRIAILNKLLMLN